MQASHTKSKTLLFPLVECYGLLASLPVLLAHHQKPSLNQQRQGKALFSLLQTFPATVMIIKNFHMYNVATGDLPGWNPNCFSSVFTIISPSLFLIFVYRYGITQDWPTALEPFLPV